jgi:hypothetical protein
MYGLTQEHIINHLLFKSVEVCAQQFVRDQNLNQLFLLVHIKSIGRKSLFPNLYAIEYRLNGNRKSKSLKRCQIYLLKV